MTLDWNNEGWEVTSLWGDNVPMELKIVCPQESFVDYIHKAGKLTLVFFFFCCCCCCFNSNQASTIYLVVEIQQICILWRKKIFHTYTNYSDTFVWQMTHNYMTMDSINSTWWITIQMDLCNSQLSFHSKLELFSFTNVNAF